MKAATTMTIGGRVEICSFATVIRAYEKEGLHLRSKSDAIWQAVEQIAALYTKKYSIDPFTNVREALEFMDRIGLPLDTNKQAGKFINRAKIYQDAKDDYGVEDLEVMKKKERYLGPGSREIVMPVAPTYRTEEEMHRDLYRQAQGLGFKGTYEDYVAEMVRLKNERGETVKETVNPKEFAAKEKVRLEAEKAAYDPSALRAAVAESA